MTFKVSAKVTAKVTIKKAATESIKKVSLIQDSSLSKSREGATFFRSLFSFVPKKAK